MTHSPPIPAANQAPYPSVEASNSPKTEKADFVARMKLNSEKQASTGSTLPVALFAGAALAGAIGYAVWSGYARSADHK